MSRSPLAYPLNRGADMDVGGAADLQTDVMRFMAIISLCLVAIFALVQSIPVAPPVEAIPEPVAQQVTTPTLPAATPPQVQEATPTPEPVAEKITLTRPKWVPADRTLNKPAQQLTTAVEPVETPPPTAQAQAQAQEVDGFTLRFESDTALTRLVATNKVGVFAIDGDRARRMTVAESRISFWDASQPNQFHEMDRTTVPAPVIDALRRTGVDADAVSWGVTLPGKLSGELDALMHEHRGGALVIGPDGKLRLETS